MMHINARHHLAALDALSMFLAPYGDIRAEWVNKLSYKTLTLYMSDIEVFPIVYQTLKLQCPPKVMQQFVKSTKSLFHTYLALAVGNFTTSRV